MKKSNVLILACCVLLGSATYAEETPEPASEQISEAAAEAAAPDEEMIAQVLDALESDTYRNTRELLKGGEVVGSGYRGDAGSGVQQMLVDFGQNITVDGIVGDQTIGALHAVQEGFGLPTTDTVDLAEFDKLLPLLYITKGDEQAATLLYDYYDETGGSGYYDYLKGCALLVDGKTYQAKEAFENSGYGAYEERAAACALEFPSDGEIWHNSELGGSDTSLTFAVNSSDDSQGMCFQMFTEDGRSAAALFITGSGTATTYLPVGTYRIRDGSGHEWYGYKDMFGPEGSYEYMTFSDADDDSKYDVYLDYGSYQLTINVSEIEEGADSVGSTRTGWDGAGSFGE